MSETQTEREVMDGGELVYRATEPAQMSFRQEDGGAAILEGRMMPYDEWTEVNSSIEGHFMERFSPGALAKTISERASRIRALFEHGMDSVLGRQAIAEIDEMTDRDDGAHFRATLLDGIPPLLVAGLRRGLYGSSIRFKPVPGKWERVRSPRPSDHNPDGIPEHTIREAYVQEFSVVTFPQYAGATAHVRSITDEVAAHKLLDSPERLLRMITALKDEPQHSEREEQEEPAPERSRSTQPSHDYLNPKEREPKWRL